MVDKEDNKQQRSRPSDDGRSSPGANQDGVKQAGDKVRASAESVAQTATEKLTETAESQKDALADRAEDVVQVVRKSAEDLSDSESWLSGYADTAADQMEKAIRTIRERDAKALMGDLEDFGRRHPGLFIGASIAIGFGLARFAKSSQDRSRDRSSGSDEAGGSHGEINHPAETASRGPTVYSGQRGGDSSNSGHTVGSDTMRSEP